MVFPVNFWILFGICMLVSSIGFKNYVWFISLGYGFSIAAQGVAMLIIGHSAKAACKAATLFTTFISFC